MGKQHVKTALITGSTDGVGRSLAKRLGEEGVRVLVHGRDRERGECTVSAIVDNGGTAGVKPRSTVEEGAEAILNLAFSPALEGQSGLYFNGLREAQADRQAYDAEARQRLQAISLERTGVRNAA